MVSLTSERGPALIVSLLVVVSVAAVGVAPAVATTSSDDPTNAALTDKRAGQAVENLSDPAEMRLSDGHGASGTTTTVTLSTENASNVSSYEANITFDPAVVQFQSADGIDLPNPTVNVNNQAGWVYITAAQAEGTVDPVLANLTFELTGPLNSETTLNFVESDTLIANESGDQLPLTLHSGTIKVATATIDLGEATSQAGNNVTLDLSANASEVAGYQANITFNASAVQVVETSGTGDFGAPIDNIDNENGWVFLANSKATGTDSPDLATITFHITEEANGTTELTFQQSATKLTNESGTEILLADYDHGSITVQECQRGDANGDGEVSSGDATLVLRNVVGLIDEAELTSCADANGDGEISSGDATIVLRIVVGLE